MLFFGGKKFIFHTHIRRHCCRRLTPFLRLKVYKFASERTRHEHLKNCFADLRKFESFLFVRTESSWENDILSTESIQGPNLRPANYTKALNRQLFWVHTVSINSIIIFGVNFVHVKAADILPSTIKDQTQPKKLVVSNRDTQQQQKNTADSLST